VNRVIGFELDENGAVFGFDGWREAVPAVLPQRLPCARILTAEYLRREYRAWVRCMETELWKNPRNFTQDQNIKPEKWAVDLDKYLVSECTSFGKLINFSPHGRY
jgi:hypothetical protein